jgi:PAS domain S-box-containing protein
MSFEEKSILTTAANTVVRNNLSSQMAALLKDVADTDDVLSVLLDAMRSFSGWSLAELWIPDIDDRDVRLTRYSCDIYDTRSFAFVNLVKQQSYPYRLFTSSPSWQTGRPFWYGNLEESGESFRRDMALEAGLKSAMSFPVFKNEQVVALVFLFDSTIRMRDAVVEKELENAAALLALEIEREHLRRAYNLYFDSTTEYLAVMSAAGNLKKVNNALQEMLGEQPEYVIENSLLYWMHPAELGSQRQLFCDILEKKINGRCETRLLNRRKDEIWVSWVFTYVSDEDYFLVSGRDITREKEILNQLHVKNLALQRTTAEVHGILANMNEVLYKFDYHGNFIEAQDSIYQLSGYRPGELVGKSTFDFFHPDDVEGIAEKVLQGIENNKPVRNHLHRFRHKNGSWRWLHTSGQAIFDENGRVAYVIGVSQDITERLEKEQQLELQEDRYRRLFMSHPVPLIIVDAETYTVSMVNDAAVKHYGYSHEEFTGLHIHQLRPEADLPAFYQRLEQDKKELDPGIFLKANWRHKKKNGDLFDAEINYHVFLHEGRRSVLSAVTDITETKRALKALEESRLRYQLFIQNSTESIFRYETTVPVPVSLPPIEQIKLFFEHAILAECNDIKAQRYGYPDAEAITGKQLKDIIPLTQGNNIEAFIQLIKNNYRLENAQVSVVTGENTIVHLSSSYVGFVENNCLVRIWGTSRDVTGERNAKLALQESEMRYRMFIKNSTEAIFRYETRLPVPTSLPAAEQVRMFFEHGWLAECNEVLAKRHGFESPEQMAGIHLRKLVSGNEENNHNTFLSFVANKYKLSNAETRITTPGGKTAYLINNLVGFEENGCLVRVWGTSKDITEEKKASQKIHYLASLVENVTDSIYTCDKDFTIISWNKAAELLYGISAEQAIGSKIGERVQVNYPGHTRESIAAEIIEKGLWKGEVEFMHPVEKKQMTLLISGNRLLDEQGELQALIITGKDITERKMAEKAVIESEERFRNMADHAPAMIWVTNEKDESVYYNQGWLGFTGNDLENERASKWIDKVHHADKAHISALYGQAFRQQTEFTGEYRLRRHDGVYRWVIDRGSPRFLHTGEFKGFIGVSFDVHERKEMEERMHKLEVEKQKLVHRATVSGQEKEKQEISAELHDNVNQIISSAKLFMEVAKRNPVEQGDMIEKAIETLGVAIQEIRRLSKSLTPPTLGRLGLAEAIEELIDDIHLTGKLTVYFNHDGDADRLLPRDIKITFYRIVQEQFNNIIKYAQTDEAFIELKLENNQFVLSINDNGIGFEFTDKRKGIGLTNMISRAAMFDGSVKVDSSPGKGCRLTISIPVPPDATGKPDEFVYAE